ncbi:diguanylate cyclase [Roseovarius azorensis]|uniref:guanylate cyclase n=1 Tax=Roseovarius azorensis TaxID=1287727 RepID=A0A1H7TDK8_9RHOB|nr:GGDEF domain-containing protein [Roseovarius azorensis]SEL82911.1 diguanylate cyclase [Roseovarius azorensis]
MSVSDDALCGLLDMLCPMHVVLDAGGRVVHAGPTLRNVFAQQPLSGRRFLEVFELRRPRGIVDMAGLRACHGTRLKLRHRERPRIGLNGALFALPDAPDLGSGAVVNLSFGISVVEAVRDFNLTGKDFAVTDPTTEMLYLIEAKSAAMEASRKLNLRLQGARRAAEEQALTDTLTGLGNRRALDRVLDRLMQSEQDFALMHLDLDFFKQVNDTLGHVAGDHVLQVAAQRMLSVLRAEDLIVRVGGDEFVLILVGLTARSRLDETAQRLIARLQEPIDHGGQDCRISGSIGATLSCGYETPDPAQMLADADLALYAAKARGRGCHVLYEPRLCDSGPGQGT